MCKWAEETRRFQWACDQDARRRLVRAWTGTMMIVVVADVQDGGPMLAPRRGEAIRRELHWMWLDTRDASHVLIHMVCALSSQGVHCGEVCLTYNVLSAPNKS
jgi:hypothetical protein